MPKHTAIYVRVSSRAQDTESQKPELEHFATGVDGPVVWYADTATGKSMDRPAWGRLYAALRAGQVESVVVWRLDRLGRTAAGLTALFDELRERKVNFVSIKDGVNLATAAGRLMANVLASVAQYETEIRGERIKAGQDAARANGKRWGGSKPGKRKKVTPEQIKAIHALHADQTPIAAIARAVKLSRPTIYAILSDK